MKAKIIGLFLLIIITQSSYAQQPPSETIETDTNYTPEQREIVNLSKTKWQWMADKNVDSLSILFDDKAMFIHMGGSWVKNRNFLQ